jgi:hypothetical protein
MPLIAYRHGLRVSELNDIRLAGEAGVSRVEWIKLVMRHGRPEKRGGQVLLLLVFEAYYQLCKLRGYRARHFLDPLPEEVRHLTAGSRLLLIWPRLPLSIRLLDRIVPYGRIAHAECVPYTSESAAAAKVEGRRVELMEITSGELISAGR